MCHPRPNVWQQRNLYRKRFPSSIRPVSGAVPRFKPGELPAPEGEENPYILTMLFWIKGGLEGKSFLQKRNLVLLASKNLKLWKSRSVEKQS